MRINKQSRPWAMAGRRLFRERLKTQDGQESVLSQDGNTVLDTVIDSKPSPFGPVAESIASADPTQRLLTMLGRFNRYISLAESGNAHDNWCDDCMDQLIGGIEIALAESWVDVKHAMTDSARVLQSYEDIGSPERALPFLKKAYEVLCLMVGDLIVGNVRSGVVEKWRTLYSDAVQELRRAGIALVDDHGEQVAVQAKPAQLSVLPPMQKNVPTVIEEKAEDIQQETLEQKGPFFFEDDEFEHEIEESQDEENEEEEEDEDEEEVFVEEETVALETVSVVEGAFSDMPFDAACDFESISDASQSDAESVGALSSAMDLATKEAWTSSDNYIEDTELGVQEDEELEDEDEDDDEEDDEDDDEEEDEEDEDEDEEEKEKDNLEVEMTVMEESNSTDNTFHVAFKFEDERSLEPIPSEDKLESFESDNIFEEKLHEHLAQLPPLPESSTHAVVEEAALETTSQDTDDATTSPIEAAELTIENVHLKESPVVTVEKPVHLEESPAQALLRITQEAFSKGDVAEAKIMALQLAAQMAVLEQERAEGRVVAVRGELEATLASIQEGDTVSLQARERLQECAARVMGHQAGIEEKRTEIEDLRGQVAAMEQRMAELDEAIRVLQQKRDDEAQLGAELQADMEMAMYTEGRFEEEMKQLLESEERAKFALEHAQNHVAKLHANREQQELLIAEAETDVLRQSKSFGDIRHTIDLVLGIVVEQPEGPEVKSEIEEISDENNEIDGTNDLSEENTDAVPDEIETNASDEEEQWEKYIIRDADDEESEEEYFHEEMVIEGGADEEYDEDGGDVAQEDCEEEDEMLDEVLAANRQVAEEGEQQELF